MAGKEQFDTPLGRALFLHSSANITTGFVRRGEPVPPALAELYSSTPSDLDWHPAIALGRMMGRLAELRSRGLRITEATVAQEGGMEELVGMLREARELEVAFEWYGINTPKEWMTVIPPEEAPPHAFRSIAHTYIAHMAARMWTSVRLARIALNQRMYNTSKRLVDFHKSLGSQLFEPPLATELETMLETSSVRGRAVIHETFGVVPYFWDPRSSKPAKAFGARVLIWPLSIAHQSTLCEDDAREYAMSTLKAVAGSEGGDWNGFPQAAEAVRMLEEGRVAEDW
jgi:hypothetical protein